MTTLFKFIHLGTIAIWSAGLIVLPLLFWQRRGLERGVSLIGCTGSPASFMWG